MSVILLRYTDPQRLNLAHAAAVYLGKEDVDNIRRPLTIMKKRHALAIFRGESARFEFQVSKVAYDHLITYTTADMRSCAGLRANEAVEFLPPAEDADPIFKEIGDAALEIYHNLVRGIDPKTQDPIKRKRLQSARSILPMSIRMKFQFQFNFLTLIHIFQQRLWTPGAQQDTVEVAAEMFKLVHEQDPELWDAVYEMFGPQEIAWQHARLRVRKDDPVLYAKIMSQYGKLETMW